MVTTIATRKTYDDYLKTPEDGQRYELIDGEIIVSASPVINHQRLVGRLHRALADAADRNSGEAFISPVAVTLNAENTFEPDLVFIGANSGAIIEIKRILGAPDLVIEVLSPSTAVQDQVRKRAIYETSGVREYWIVDPIANRVTALALEDGRYRAIVSSGAVVSSLAAPGFAVDTVKLFAVRS